MFKRSIISRLLFCTLVSLPVPAFAVSQMSISSPSCDGNYIVQGNFEGVTGVELHITYDPSTLQNPDVMKGSLAATMNFGDWHAMPNPVNIGWLNAPSPVTGRGTVATIHFDKVGASAGVITGWTAIVASGVDKLPLILVPPINCSNAGTDSGSTSGTNGSGNQSGSGDSGGGNTTTTPGTTTTTTTTPPPATTPTAAPTGYLPYIVGGTVTLPTDQQSTEKRQADPQPAPPESAERPYVPQDTAPAYQSGSEAPAPKAAEEPAPAPKRIPSVLERFQLFTGEKTVKNLTALFDRDSAATFSQSPAIVIADGKKTAKVAIGKVKGEKAPNFAFTSAHYVSLARSSDGGWEVEVLPDKGAAKASVTMLVNGTVQELPLAVAPKAAIGKGGEPTEADFLLFLKERGTDKAPKYDLNGDGKRDYIDDYIFTANYLVKKNEMAKQKQTAQQKK